MRPTPPNIAHLLDNMKGVRVWVAGAWYDGFSMEKMPQNDYVIDRSPDNESEDDLGSLVRKLRARGDFEKMMEKIAQS